MVVGGGFKTNRQLARNKPFFSRAPFQARPARAAGSLGPVWPSLIGPDQARIKTGFQPIHAQLSLERACKVDAPNRSSFGRRKQQASHDGESRAELLRAKMDAIIADARAVNLALELTCCVRAEMQDCVRARLRVWRLGLRNMQKGRLLPVIDQVIFQSACGRPSLCAPLRRLSCSFACAAR